LQQHREQRAARRANDPFYLGSGPTAKSKSPEDDVPIAVLTKEDLGLKGSFKDLKKPRPSKKKSADIAVLKDEEMPEGALASDEEVQTKDKENVFADIDFSSPLRPDEQLPVRTHRTVKAPVAPTAKPQKSESKKGHREKKKEGESSSGKHHRHHKRHSKKETEPSQDGSGKLIDFEGGFDPVPSSPTSAIAQNDSLPQFIDKSGYSALDSPAPIHKGEEEEAEVTEPKKRSHRSKHGKSKSSSRDGKEGREAKETKDGKVKRRSSSSSKSSKPTKESPSQPAIQPTSSQQVSSPTPAPRPQYKPLCQDENLGVIYELRINPSEPKKILVSFAFKNLSQEQISSIAFSIPGNMNSKMVQESSAQTSFTIPPGGTNTHNILFSCTSILQPQKLPGSVSYQVGSTPVKKDFQLVFPCSSFIIPVKLSSDEFIAILSQGLGLSSADIKVPDDFRASVVQLATLLHVELIISDTGVSLYGKTIQNHSVAVYIKPVANSVLHIDIKCSDGTFGGCLLNEVTALFPRA